MGAGTLETLEQQIGIALQPLEARLTPDNIIQLLAELGLQFPAQLTAQPGFTNALNQGATAASALPGLLQQLASDIASNNDTGIVQDGLQLLQQIANIVAALGQIGAQLGSVAASLPGMNVAEVQAFAQNLPANLLSYLLITYVESVQPGVAGLANLLGIIKYQNEPGVSGDPTHPPYIVRELQLANFGALLSSPKDLLQQLYSWGSPSFDATAIVSALSTSLKLMGILPEFNAPPGPGNSLDLSLLTIQPNVSASPPGLALSLNYDLPGDFNVTLPLSALWSVQAQVQGAFAAGLQADITPPATISFKPPSGTFSGELDVALVAQQPDSNHPIILIGQAGGSALQTASFTFGTRLQANWDAGSGSAAATFLVETAVAGGKLILDMSEADGFLSSVTSGTPIEADFDFSASWAPDAGIHIVGGGQLQLTLPVNLDLGPVSVSTLYVDAGVSGGEISLALAAALGLTLGPIAVSVDQVGFQGQLGFPPQGGNLGFANLTLGFKPPNGLGLSIDAGVVSGGGYISFDQSKGQYAGVLDVTLAEIVAVKVIGVLDTELPDGSSGYSFLLIITFNLPPIQLGFGFTLSGVGGLGGVNRTMVQDALRAGLRAHTLDDILFPDNPVANAPQTISDIESFFPPQQGRYLFGPMVQIGWGELNLIEFALGIILEVPDPVRLAILGEITVAIPDPDVALISFKIDVLGTIDFGLDKIAIDGDMYDSYVLWFQISGDMAFRLNWGANPEFLLSLGGFNPKFQPPPDVPALQRLSVSLGSGSNPRFSSNSYFAVTSNTLQFGANVDAYAAAGGFSVNGYIGWDALFIFSPFSFEIDFSAGFDISYDGTSLAGIHLNASLSGPQPWHLHGSASFNILFFSVSATIDVSWGDSTTPTLPSQPVMPPLLAALGDPRNWSVMLPPANSQTVSLRTIVPDAGSIVVHPLGSLSVRETIVPLDTPITKFNSVTPSDGNEFQISAVTVNGAPADTQPLPEYFAIAQFTDMSDADKLSAPSYEPFDAGVTLGAIPIENGDDTARTVAYQEHYIDDYNALSRLGSIYQMPANVHSVLVRSGQAAVAPSATTGLRTYVQPGMKSPISVSDIGYAVASTSDLTARTDILGTDTTHYAAATALRAFIAANPDQQGAAQVVTAHEVAA